MVPCNTARIVICDGRDGRCGALKALLAPDVRPVLRWFQRPAHIARFANKAAEESGKSR